MTAQFASYHRIKYGRLRDDPPHIILPLIINNATLTIVSSRNSVRVVFLIAWGWRAKVLATLGYNQLKSDR